MFTLPPPPDRDLNSPAWRDWFYKLQQFVGTEGSIQWIQLTDVPTNLDQIANLTGSANQILGKNAANDEFELKTLVEGSNITITHGAGTITIESSGGGAGGPDIEAFAAAHG